MNRNEAPRFTRRQLFRLKETGNSSTSTEVNRQKQPHEHTLFERAIANLGNIRLGKRDVITAASIAVVTLVTACGGEVSSTPVVPANKPVSSSTEKPKARSTVNPDSRFSPADRLKKVERSVIQVSDSVRKAFEAVTNSYSGIKHTEAQIKKTEFQRLRQLAFSETTTQQIVNMAQEGKIFFDFNHPAVLSEFDYAWFIGNLPVEEQKLLLEAYAEAVVKGLERVYRKDQPLAVALEIGHMSVPPMDKVNKVNEDRKKRKVPEISPTRDTGAVVRLSSGKVIKEKDFNIPLAQLIALKIMEGYPYWFPVLNSKEDGFPVQRFIEKVNDSEEYYIGNADCILSMKYKWEKLATELEKVGMKMVRISIHFNGADKNDEAFERRGGFVMVPVYGRYATESQRVAKPLSDAISEEVRKARPNDKKYTNGVDTEQNDDPLEEYWTLNGWDKDKKEDVQEGKPERVTGISNKLLAKIRKAFKEQR